MCLVLLFIVPPAFKILFWLAGGFWLISRFFSADVTIKGQRWRTHRPLTPEEREQRSRDCNCGPGKRAV